MKMQYRYRLILSLTACLFVLAALAQNEQKADSLQRLLPKLDGKNKIETLLELAGLLVMEDPQVSIKFSEQAVELAKQTGSLEYMARAEEFIGWGYFYSYNYSRALEYLEKSLVLYEKDRNHSKIAKVKQNIGLCYLKMADFDTAKEYLHVAAAEFLRQDDMDALANSYLNLGLVYYLLSDYASALEYYAQASEIYAETGKREMQSQLYNRMGMTYYSLGIYDQAVKYVMESIELKNPGDLKGLAIGYNNLGAIYDDLQEYDKALENYQLSLALYEETGDSLGMPYVLTNIGGIYADRDETETALANYKLSLKLSKAAGDDIQTVKTKHNMARIYLDEGNTDDAMTYFRDMVEISRKAGYLEGVAHGYTGLGDVALKKGELSEAEKLYRTGLSIADSIHYPQAQKQIHFSLSELMEKSKRFDRALYHHQRYTQVKDSLLNADRTRIISEMETKYETEKKQQENDLLKAENELQNRRIKNLYLVIGGLFVLLAAITVLIWQYRRISRARKMLAESEAARLQEKVEHQGRELASSALALSRNLTLINKLLEDLKSLTPMIKEEGLPVLMNISRSVRRLDSGTAWKEFEMRFENVHTQFYENLINKFPSLTSNEMRLCAFLKLGMSTKEISAITFQTIRAIEAARLRLRKKLDLDGSHDLNVFLQQF